MNRFKTFFMGGYECADMINKRRQRVDLLTATRHDQFVDEDYRLLKNLGICTVREGIRWSVVEKEPFVYDFAEVKNRILAAQKAGIQQLWDICHFGYPDDLTPLHPQFTERLVKMCKAFTRFYRSLSDDPLIIIPVNEISFLSYLSNAAATTPFIRHSGGRVKYELCRAVIDAIKAIKAIDPAAQAMLVEPLIKVHPRDANRITPRIHQFNEGQFEAMDMITGRLNPELGGHPDLMDLTGFNYYYNNQWRLRGGGVCWRNERELRNFPGLLKDAANRYGKPVVLSETGHYKDDRCDWMLQITQECIEAMQLGVNLLGICIYPVLDRPDWDTMQYIPCGIWGYNKKTGERFEETSYLSTVKECMQQMGAYLQSRKEGTNASSALMQHVA
jgi:beta-glucosidase/6-phospho-beta-glucosidase/beta-galactosidase